MKHFFVTKNKKQNNISKILAMTGLTFIFLFFAIAMLMFKVSWFWTAFYFFKPGKSMILSIIWVSIGVSSFFSIVYLFKSPKITKYYISFISSIILLTILFGIHLSFGLEFYLHVGSKLQILIVSFEYVIFITAILVGIFKRNRLTTKETSTGKTPKTN